jgi:GNAT superfamily N-acetyltransferase
MRPWERNAANLSASLSFYGPAVEQGGVKLITSPVSYSVFNIALLTEPVSDFEGELERRIHVASDHYRRTGRPWSFWICEHYLGPRGARRLIRTFKAEGMECIAESPGMETAQFPAPRRPLPALEIRRVHDQRTRSAFARLVAGCFNIPIGITTQVYESEQVWLSPLRMYIGYHEGNAVASAGVIAEAGAIGIYSVATLPTWRRIGMAEAVMRFAVDELRAEGAEGPLVLQSSPAGLELYRKLGFSRTTRYFVFATE